MMSITMSNFLKDLEQEKLTNNIRICEYNNSCFSIMKKDQEVLYLDIASGNIYDNLYNELTTYFKGRYETFWIHSITNKYFAFIVIDKKITIKLEYFLLEGQQWLYQHHKY